MKKTTDSNDHVPLSQLWILRLLKQDRIRRNFVRSHGFRDDDLARFLDLHDWIDIDLPDFDRKKVSKLLDSKLAQKEGESPTPPGLCAKNCELLGRKVGLNLMERDFLLALVLFEQESAFSDALNLADIKHRRDFAQAAASMLNLPLEKVLNLSTGNGKLAVAALAKWGSNRRASPTFQLCNSDLAEKLMQEPCTLRSLLSSIVAPPPAPTLRYKDYPHITDSLSDLRLHIRRALKQKLSGVNVFIHGSPGTGKSELSRVIAREMRAALYEISFEDSDGDSISGQRRLESLRAAQTLLRNQRSLLVFDEAEDIFRGESIFERSFASRRKAWMNRMFESNEIPTFWISNSGDLDPAFLRRFDFILELKVPPKAQRIRTYRRICGSKVSPHLVEQIAHYDSLTAGVVAKANNVARGICENSPRKQFEATLLRQIKQTLSAQGVDVKKLNQPKNKVPGLYSLDFLNCDMQLGELPQNLARNASCRICLYGPPGTGKTTLGYWLAEEMGTKIHLKKASDLLGPFLGQTEQNIASAFAEATREKAILMIDEVDSFLQDRGQAVRGWEVQQVNELLTQMENFEGIFIASTNLMEGIDQAALRRFDLKLRFGYLDAEQNERLFISSCRELNLPSPDDEAVAMLSDLPNATPGDFANCRRQAGFKGFQQAGEFARAVAEECLIKADRGSRKLGFGE